jgi:FtsZ-binding cell division protein ZapB
MPSIPTSYSFGLEIIMDNNQLIAALCTKVIELQAENEELRAAHIALRAENEGLHMTNGVLHTENNELRAAYAQQQQAWRARETYLVTENSELRAAIRVRSAV